MNVRGADGRRGSILVVVFLLLVGAGGPGGRARAQETVPSVDAKAGLLKLLEIEPAAESVDFIRTKTQFQLHTLLTEQRHQKTWPLGERIQKDTLAGLKMLSSVDDDILVKLEELAAAPAFLEQAARAIEDAILGGGRSMFTVAGPRADWPSRWRARSGVPFGGG